MVKRIDDDYAAVCLLTDQVRANWDVVEEILATVDGDRDRGSETGTDSASGGDENGDGNREGDATNPEGGP